MDYLGHIISEWGVAVDPTKIKAILEWLTPISIKGVHGFLDLAGNYRKFIHHFRCIAVPLNQLLSKEGFKWSEAAKLAFNKLKETLTSLLVLCLSDFSQCFVIECNASVIRIGAVLSQNNRPIAYFSEALKGSTS